VELKTQALAAEAVERTGHRTQAWAAAVAEEALTRWIRKHPESLGYLALASLACCPLLIKGEVEPWCQIGLMLDVWLSRRWDGLLHRRSTLPFLIQPLTTHLPQDAGETVDQYM
jgi:hypothetical protein